jgi:DNA-binding CsgD family transcriptional regulator
LNIAHGKLMKSKLPKDELVLAVYAAATGEGTWAGFLKLLSEATDSPMAHITYVSNARQNARQPGEVGVRQWIEHYGLSKELLEVGEKHGHEDNWWARAIHGPIPEGWVGRGSELWPEAEMIQTNYYREVVRKHDFFRLCAAILIKRPGELAGCVVARGERDAEFDEDVLDLLRELTPHLHAAISLYNKVGELRQNLDSLELSLEQFGIGVIVVDITATVIFVNSTGQQLLELREGLFLKSGKIRSASHKESEQLQSAIQSAIESSQRTGEVARDRRIGVASVSRMHGRPFHLFISPWHVKGQLALKKPAAVLLLAQPERKIPQEAWLQTLYGLTKAESKLVALIAGGMAGPAAAKELGLSPESVRTRLKTVFSKTDTQRQSDLVSLLATFPPG